MRALGDEWVLSGRRSLTCGSDAFGDVHPDTQRTRSRTTPSAWAQAARAAKNETNFRDGQDMFQSEKRLVFYDRKEYDQALREFRKRGYETWPDGRALETVLTYTKE